MTSGCLTIGTAARLAVVARVVDTGGQPVTGATVTFGSSNSATNWVDAAAVPAPSVPGTYYRSMIAPGTNPSAPQSIVGASVTWCGSTVQLSPPHILDFRSQTVSNGYNGVAPHSVGGCASIQGHMRIRVVEAETGAPISGASVLVGSSAATPYVTSMAQLFPAPSATGANTGTTDAQGYLELQDFGTALYGPQHVTAGAPGRAYVTHWRFNGADQVFALPLRRPVVTTHRFTGGTALPIPMRPDCSYATNGMVLEDGPLSRFAFYDFKELSAPQTCASAGALGTTAVPENLYLPPQTWGLSSSSCTGYLDTSWARDVRPGNRVLTMPLLHTPAAGFTGFSGVLQQSTWAAVGYLQQNVTAPVAAPMVIMADTYPVAVTFNTLYTPPGTDLTGFVLLDFEGGSGTGAVGINGIGMKPAGTPGNNVVVRIGERNGAPISSHYLGAVVAGFADPASAPAVSADLRHAKVVAYVRNGSASGQPFTASANATVNMSNFLARSPAAVTDGGTVFTFGNATNTAATPAYSVSTLVIRRKTFRPQLACQTTPDVVIADYPQWIVFRTTNNDVTQCSVLSSNPSGCERFALPTLPATFPLAGPGTQRQSGFEGVVGSGASCSGACAVGAEQCQVPQGTTQAARCMGSDGARYFTERYTWLLESRLLFGPLPAVTLPQADFTSYPISLTGASSNQTEW